MKRVAKTVFTCDKCGKETEYTTKDEYSVDFDFAANECWEIRLGRAGYGSGLDGCDVNFDLCDDCLIEFVNTFKHKNVVWNSGSNTGYFPPDDDEVVA